MIRALVIALALGVAAPALAHDADVAAFALRPATGEKATRGWVLDVHVAQAALQRALGDGAPVDAKAWREAAVAYLRAHVRITSDGMPVPFGGGGIKVGSHQTDARFVYDIADGATLAITIDAFAEDGHQSNVLRMRGAEAKTVVLTPENGFAVDGVVLRR